MKIAVIGAGAMGSLFGGRLAQAGHSVTMIDVVPMVINTINQRGILIDDAEGTHAIPVSAARAEDMQETVDLAILFTKTVYSRSAISASGTYIGKKTPVLTLQNGIGNDDLLAEFFPKDQILIGVTNYPSDLIGPGHVASRGDGYIRFMSLTGEVTPQVKRVESVLQEAGFNASLTPKVMEAVWEKVAFNAVMNGTAAVCRLPVKGIADSECGLSLARHIAEETVKVASAWQVCVDMDSLWNSILAAFEQHGSHYPSMAQDVIQKRETEVGSIHGGILAKARMRGLEIPYTETIYDLIQMIQNHYDPPV